MTRLPRVPIPRQPSRHPPKRRRRRWRHCPKHNARRLGLLPLALLALVVGVITGIGAVVFRGLIGLVHNVFFLGHFSFVYEFKPFHAVQSVGGGDHPGAGDRRHRRHLDRLEFRAGSERTRRAGGDGRDLLPAGDHPARRCGGEVHRLGAGDRHRCGGRARGTHHPDRLRARVHTWARSSGCRRGSASRWSRPAPGPASRRRSTRRSAGFCSPPN